MTRIRDHVRTPRGLGARAALFRQEGFLLSPAATPSLPGIGAPEGSLGANVPARALYVRRYAWLGAVLMACAAGAALLYLGSTPQRPNRALADALCGLAMLVASVVALTVGRVVGRRRETAFFVGWMLAALILIVGVAAADGGSGSPLSVLLILPVVYASIGFPLRAVRWNANVSQIGLLLLMVIGHDWGSEAWYRFLVLGIFNLLAVASATNRTSYEVAQRELARRASHDDLTGCLTHGAFGERLRSEEAAARRYGRSFSVVVADIDHFKSVNDTFGHAAGDAVLREFGATLRRATRRADVVGRLGGDEFGVLLTETADAGAAAWADELLRLARGLPSPAPISLSLGVAGWTGEADTADDVLLRADAALYEAKRQGRDRAVPPRLGLAAEPGARP